MDYQTFTYFHVVLENEKPSEEEEKEARMQREKALLIWSNCAEMLQIISEAEFSEVDFLREIYILQ